MPSSRLACAAAALAVLPQVHAVPGPAERPVALILRADAPGAEIARPAFGTRLRAHPGMVVFAGDSLIQREGVVEIAFCARHEIVSFFAPGVVQFESANYRAQRGRASSIPAPVCKLPMVHKEPVPRNLSPFGGQERQTGSLEDRIRHLSPGQQAALHESLAEIARHADSSVPGLLLDVARAAAFDDARLWADAADQYRKIRNRWPEADWTRDTIERVREQELLHTAADLSSSGDEGERLFAFVVGVSEYLQPEIRDLRFADQDARKFAEFLMSDRGGGLKHGKNLLLLENHEATRDRVTNNLAAFVQGKARTENTLIIYIAAHGAYACVQKSVPSEPCIPGQDGEEPYILVHDSHPEDPKLTGIRMGDLHDLITSNAGLFGTVILYLDVCHTGALSSLPLRTNLTSAQIKHTFADALAPDAKGDVGLLLASSRLRPQDRRNEYALEESFLGTGHGVFTYFVLRALNSDVQSAGNTVLIGDLMSHVRTQVRQLTGNKQTPDLTSTRPDIVLVADRSRTGIEIQEIPSNIRKQIVIPRLPHSEQRIMGAIRSQSAGMPQVIQRATEEERGQQQLLTYLKGEQVPQNRQDFEACAGNFARALAVAGDAAFTESRYLFCQARVLIFDKRYSEAEVLLERSIRIDRNRAYSYNALGIAHLEQAHFSQAVRAFQDAICLAPDWAYPVHNLALAQEQEGSYHEAISSYRRAMSLAPYASYPAYNLALLLQRLNRLDEAKAMYETAIRIAIRDRQAAAASSPWPHLTEAYNALGTLAVASGKIGAARDNFLKAIRENPANLVAEHNLALLEAGPLRRPAQAQERWRRLLSLGVANRIDAVVRLSLAESLAAAGKADDSIAEYRRLLVLEPGFTTARRQLALLYLKNGRLKEALSVVEADAGNPSLQSILDDLIRIQQGREPIDNVIARTYREARSRRAR